ncbi:MAG: hypothetical protein ACLR07_06250 [Christensenellales bacterium]
MSIHFPDWVSPALALAQQTLESCHAPDSFDFVGQIDETLPREGYRMQLSPWKAESRRSACPAEATSA